MLSLQAERSNPKLTFTELYKQHYYKGDKFCTFT